jgi:hypothetical protein
MAISTLRKLLGAQLLRRGDGVIALPDSRRKERLLAGRTKLASKEVKMEVLIYKIITTVGGNLISRN